MSAYRSMPPVGSQEYTGDPSGTGTSHGGGDTSGVMGASSVTKMIRPSGSINAYGGMPPIARSSTEAVGDSSAEVNAYGGMPPLGRPTATITHESSSLNAYGGMPPIGSKPHVAPSPMSHTDGTAVPNAYGGMPPISTGGVGGGGGGGSPLNAYGGMPPLGGVAGHPDDSKDSMGGGLSNVGASVPKSYMGMPKMAEVQYKDMPPCREEKKRVDYVSSLWRSIAGEAFTVEWEWFYAALEPSLGEHTGYRVKQLFRCTLGDPVTLENFKQLLVAFGPTLSDVSNSFVRFQSLPWFYGSVSRQVSEAILSGQSVGTFLVRLSSSKMGSFDLAIARGGKVTHVLLEGTEEKGVRLRYAAKDGSESGERLFASVEDAVDWYVERGDISLPYAGSFIREPYFFGTIGSTLSVKLLMDQPKGTYLIRLSSSPGCFTSSFVTGEGKITHSRISPNPEGGVKEDSSGKTWDTMESMISDMNDKGILVNPCPRS